MTPAVTGGLLGLAGAGGLWLVVATLVRARRPSLDDRLVPYLRDLPEVAGRSGPATSSLLPASAWWSVFGPSVRRVADVVEQVVGGGTSVRRRQRRLGVAESVETFRVEQVLWGAGAFAATAGAVLVWSLGTPVAPLPALVLCVVAFAAGVLLRDQALTRAVRDRERRMVEEFPTVADLMALSVAAGEGPVAALERVVATSHGEMSHELRGVLAAIRTGTPMTVAFDQLAARTGLASLSRFAEGLAVAVERGTPLVDVLHAQAADARESSRRELIEQGARKEVAMMIPVVFLLLPVTVVFAFFPGLIGLDLTTR
ncbi:type II secretion system F family protein [Solicola sp. PLA-1-18]|uniref:type II secretion system F family protein n=1 Tax=Solicola sp. PLA-1-18 TaxID=3380532 RepID=UPI003B7E0EBF